MKIHSEKFQLRRHGVCAGPWSKAARRIDKVTCGRCLRGLAKLGLVPGMPKPTTITIPLDRYKRLVKFAAFGRAVAANHDKSFT